MGTYLKDALREGVEIEGERENVCVCEKMIKAVLWIEGKEEYANFKRKSLQN